MGVTTRHTVIIEYHLTTVEPDRGEPDRVVSAEPDRMVVRNVYGELPFAKRQCYRIRKRLGYRPDVVVDAWRIEDAMERVVAQGKA